MPGVLVRTQRWGLWLSLSRFAELAQAGAITLCLSENWLAGLELNPISWYSFDQRTVLWLGGVKGTFSASEKLELCGHFYVSHYHVFTVCKQYLFNFMCVPLYVYLCALCAWRSPWWLGEALDFLVLELKWADMWVLGARPISSA